MHIGTPELHEQSISVGHKKRVVDAPTNLKTSLQYRSSSCTNAKESTDAECVDFVDSCKTLKSASPVERKSCEV
ncbi:unnamed protein product [Schistosoma turkestanicum]|nr:unnamed protein product [Schistosoma turkestanicum]